jgi:glycosyltransferase involved in cell wall biosynthesis
MTDRVRVLHVVQNLNFGGMERLIAEMARRTDASRFETHVLALQYLGHFSEGLDQYATLHLADPMSRLSMIRPTALARQIREIAPQIVHTHSGVWYKAGLAAHMAKVPFAIHTDHGRQNPDPWTYRMLDRLASYRTDIVVRVVANGVDTERYQPHPYDGFLHRELSLDLATPLLGSVGRLEAIKGYEVMIAAFAKLLKEHTAEFSGSLPPKLILIGDGSQRSSLEHAAQQAGIRDSVYFLGWRSDIEVCLRAFTLFTMSSHSEGTSVSLLEAMSSGLCPVVTEVGGNPAVLGEALRHRLVPPANPNALATVWLDALCNSERLAQDAIAARQRVLDAFSLDAMVRHYEQLYEEGARR